jgi:hypothetical protein
MEKYLLSRQQFTHFFSQMFQKTLATSDNDKTGI